MRASHSRVDGELAEAIGKLTTAENQVITLRSKCALGEEVQSQLAKARAECVKWGNRYHELGQREG